MGDNYKNTKKSQKSQLLCDEIRQTLSEPQPYLIKEWVNKIEEKYTRKTTRHIMDLSDLEK